MSSLFRRTYTDKKTGRKVKTKNWYGKFKDRDGVVRRVPLSPNKAAAQMMLADLVREAEQSRAGIRNPHREHQARPLADHLAEWEAVLHARGNVAKYVGMKLAQVRAVFARTGFVMPADLSASKVEAALAEMRKGPRFGTQTSNHHLAAVKQFSRWLVRDRRTPDDPFAHLAGGNVKLDRRHQRRDLSDGELVRLLGFTRTAGPFRGLSGPDREALYLTSLYTGFRASELASLTPESFAFADAPPTVTVAAAYAKNRREDTVPLHPDAARFLTPWVAGKPAGVRLWPGKWAGRTEGGKIIKRDLEAARVAWVGEATDPTERAAREASDFLRDVDAAGFVVDFHSLRHTFVSRLVKAGVKPKDAQALARHSTITLTMDRYAHVGLADTAAAVAMVPALAGPDLAPAAANRGGRERTTEETTGAGDDSPAPPQVLKLRTVEDSGGTLISGEGGIL